MDHAVKSLSLLIAFVLPAAAASEDPKRAAVDFVEKIRLKKVNLEPGGDTALSPHTAAEKRREIARRLERMSRDIGSGPLEAGEVKLDENYAGVLVRNASGFDPGGLKVFGVALVKRGTSWEPAPLPASFENAGVGYTPESRRRLSTLESWLLRGQALELDQLRENARERMSRRIREKFDPETIRHAGAGEVARLFLTACQKRDLHTVLGLLGGLESIPPDDWPQRLRAAEVALASPAPARPWRLLMAPEVLRLPAGGEEEPGTFPVICLDPAGISPLNTVVDIETLDFSITRDDSGLWRIDPPSAFIHPTITRLGRDPDGDEDEPDGFNGPHRNRDGPAGNSEQFLDLLREQIPAKPQIDTATGVLALTAALKAPDLAPLMALLDLGGDPDVARRGCARAAQSWWALHRPPGLNHPLPLATHSSDDAGAAIFQFFSPHSPEARDFRAFFFDRSGPGWLLSPGLEPGQSGSELQARARTWATDQARKFQDVWQVAVLGPALALRKIEPDRAPDDAAARATVTKFLTATRSDDLSGTLKTSAWSGDPRGTAMALKNLGYEIGGARNTSAAPEVTGVYTGRYWAAVGVRTSSGNETSYPLYVVVGSPEGPRVLLEADLFANGGRSRDFLNKVTFQRLRKPFPAEAVDELQTLLAAFQKDLEKN